MLIGGKWTTYSRLVRDQMTDQRWVTPIPRNGTVRYDLLKYGNGIIQGRGDKALWVAGNLIASGDIENLPVVTGSWQEISVREAEVLVT